MKKVDNVFWGLSFVIYGILLCLSILGVLNTEKFVHGWALFFVIVPCFLGVSFGNHLLESLVGLLFSVFLLFIINGLIDFLLVFELIIPTIIILIGLYMIKKSK